MSNELSVDSREFLLAQFASAMTKRSFYEGRIESETQRIFTSIGGGIAFIGVVSQLGTDSTYVFVIVQMVAIVLAVLGYRYIRIIPVNLTHIDLQETQAALIRRFFVDLDPSIRNHIILPIADTNYSLYRLAKSGSRSWRINTSSVGIRIVKVFNSAILALMIALIPIDIQLLLGSSAPIFGNRLDWILAAVVAVAFGIWFYAYQGRTIDTVGGRFEAGLRQTAKSLIEAIDQTNGQPERDI
jgi:membrane protein implicated in regulation of membrane protease activity